MSTAKSMATLYLNGKRSATTSSNSNRSGTLNSGTQRFKSSTSNLAQSAARQATNASQTAGKSRLKSTSMTNLVDQQTTTTTGGGEQAAGSRMQRPVSRNALDSIHNGMNAKYAQVQSKVYLQNIKPQQQPNNSKIPGSKTLQQQQQAEAGASASTKPQPLQPATASRLNRPTGAGRPSGTGAAGERSMLAAKLRVLEDELASQAGERDSLRQELERERAEKAEQVQQLKTELQEKLAEHDRQNEEYHRKLLEAYELADQNRRAADSVLSESRQRDEESRKRVEELESQLGELKEFVSMKEEMMGKMYELREQLRQERERYEEQLKSLHQVFENEKLSRADNSSMLLASSPTTTTNNNMGLKLTDENSNHYFNRMKPALESSESINKPYTGTGCRQCQSGSSQLHKSEQDIYGSKMSTRMQDTAKSAWKASRKFASSVITGGVNLSACRQCTKRTGSSSPPPQPKQQQHSPQDQVTFNCTASNKLEDSNNNNNESHTSVIQVGTINLEEAAQQQLCTPPMRLKSAAARQQQQPSTIQIGQDQQQAGDFQQQQQPTSLIRVDENNKLTIVTKFNDSECQGGVGGLEMGASSSVSERSRCESSSSGRGTSSDAGSAASQNGDDEDSKRQVSPSATSAGETPAAAANEPPRPAASKGHRRRASLFKASKVFGGSQVSLHKLKSLFSSTKGLGVVNKPAKGADQISASLQQQQLQVSLDHIEASRLRCMELNQAITVSTVSGRATIDTDTKQTSPSVKAPAEGDSENTSSPAQRTETTNEDKIGQGAGDDEVKRTDEGASTVAEEAATTIGQPYGEQPAAAAAAVIRIGS